MVSETISLVFGETNAHRPTVLPPLTGSDVQMLMEMDGQMPTMYFLTTLANGVIGTVMVSVMS